MATLKKLITGSVVLGFVVLLNACVVSPGPRGYYSEPYGQTSLVYWYYYPNYGVYYHPVDHYYYYQIGGIWRRDYSLPAGWVLAGEPRVRMQLSGIPYQRYSDHRRYYPPKRVTHIVTPNRPHNDDRDNHQYRPDHDGRHGSDDSRRHTPDMDRKEGGNMFVPHTKGNSVNDKRQYLEKSGKSGSYKADKGSPLKELKKGSSYSATKSQGNSKVKTQKQAGKEKASQSKDDAKGKYRKDDEVDNDKQSDNDNSKNGDRRKDWYRGVK